MNPDYQQPQPAPESQQPYSPPPPIDYKQNPLAVMQGDEQVVCEIKRHPFGLFGMYIGVGLSLVLLGVAVALTPHYIPSISSQFKTLMALVFVIVAAVALLFMYVSTTIYKNNRWIVTTDSITQIDQVGLFRKQTSQLSFANLEDVTAEQSGIVQSMFNFGGLRVETAGDRSKFFFSYCPNPNYYARQILACREAFINDDPARAKRANDLLDTPQQ
jgi:uncharacterized membrane protein YdbT with pleckstrin-like domain